eukprot:Hpha_TRINITY_DN18617_c0_g1::TRINITY_DN18617_c0_g1_i1::g.115676::m.115676
MPSHEVVVFILGAVGSESIMVASDVTSQHLEYHLDLETCPDMTPTPSPALGPIPAEPVEGVPVKPMRFNWRRLGRFTLVTTITGFVFQGWWYYMDHMFPGTSFHAIMQKTLWTQGLDVVIIPVEQASLAFLNPKITVRDKLRREWAVMQLFAISFLPACHILQFLYVPLPWQIWVSRANGFVCGIVLSIVSHRAMPPDDGGCYLPCIPDSWRDECCPPPDRSKAEAEQDEEDMRGFADHPDQPSKTDRSSGCVCGCSVM